MKQVFCVFLLILCSFKMISQISILGTASPSGDWDTDHNLAEGPDGVWTGTYPLSANEIKFRSDGMWTTNWGGSSWPGGAAISDGPNINVAHAGNYTIQLNLNDQTYNFTFLASNVGINNISPEQTLDVTGKIKVGDDVNTPTAGTIRWNDATKDFEGYDGTQWYSFTRTNQANWGHNNISVHENLKRTASDGDAEDKFGWVVSISGDYALVGAPFDDFGSNANQGSAYVFVRSGTTWAQQAMLTADDGDANDNFGWSVSISGDYAIVGAPRDGIGSNTYQGSAYIFIRSGTTWTQQAKLTASDGAQYDSFGFSVSISGDYAIVGTPNDGIGSNPGQGSAYIFVRSGITWTQQAKLTASDGAQFVSFGHSVSISGDYAIAGAYGDPVGSNASQGSAYIFVRSGTTWDQQTKLTASDGEELDFFGWSVSISGDYTIVGAQNDGIGSNTDQGSAYIFIRSGTTWTQQAKLTASDGAEFDSFGWSVSISGDYAIVGAAYDLIGGNVDQGSAYIFVRSGTTWTQQTKLTASDGADGDLFGHSVSISGDNVIVGALNDDIGNNTNQGSIYFFKKN